MTKTQAVEHIATECPDCPCLPLGCNPEHLDPMSGDAWLCAACGHMVSDDVARALGVYEVVQ